MRVEKVDSGQILDVLRRSRRPVMTLKAILTQLTARGGGFRGARKLVLRHLRRLVDSGAVEQVVGGYRLGRRDGLREGVVETARGAFAATVVDDGRRSWSVQSALPLETGQRVLFAPLEGSAHEACAVAPVDERCEQWVGVLRANRRGAWVEPYQDRARWRVEIAHRDLAGAKDGEVVVAIPASSAQGTRRDRDAARGKVVERLGRPGDPEADFRSVAWNHRLRLAFEEDVEAEAAAAAAELSAAELQRRVDLRGHSFLTIDPEDARDHDDAVCVESAGQRLRLWVAIADVSHFVAPGSALDREALRRGNSVYFPDRVVPMLPERISQDLCSLRPDCDRRVVVVEMSVDRAGRVRRSNFYPGVIRSRARLSYEQAAALMDRDSAAVAAIAPEIAEQVQLLAQLESRLSRRRFEDGSIDFALSESQIELDSSGRAQRIVKCERTRAHRAIEEAMLVANRAVSERLAKSAIGCIYRTHEAPDASDLEKLQDQLHSFGLLGDKAVGPLDSKQIHRALRRADGRPEAPLVNMVALRAMKRACYAAENRGHFALGFPSYLHFTSPIRRYSDLVVHRALKHWLALGLDALDPLLETTKRTDAVARRISFRERVAVDAERDAVNLKKCAFMAQFVGDCFPGVVTGVAAHGLYVTLDEHDVDGLVPSASLGDGFSVDERAHALVARRGGARYRLGDTIRVQVEDVNLVRGWIRFAPDWGDARRPGDRGAGESGTERGSGRRGAKKGKGKGKSVKRGRRQGQKARRRGAPSRGRDRR